MAERGVSPIREGARLRGWKGRKGASVSVSDNFHRALGQRVEERLAVTFGQDAIIQNDDDARVGLCADESAHALAELQDRFGQRELAEGIAPARFDGFNSSFDQRMVRESEW